MAKSSGVTQSPSDARSVSRWGEVGSLQQPLTLTQPAPLSGAEITVGGRGSVRRTGDAETVLPMTDREGASAGIVYATLLVMRFGAVRPGNTRSTCVNAVGAIVTVASEVSNVCVAA